MALAAGVLRNQAFQRALVLLTIGFVAFVSGGEHIVYAQVCGDNTCDPGENSLNCPQDCALCGNGILELGEECDDGNTTPNDGCDQFCQEEVFCGNGNCEPGAGEDSLSCPQDCPPVCGNGILELGEECDDGNTDNGDGCSSACTEEVFCGNNICEPLEGEDSVSCPQDCPPVCGNGTLELGEECDDGNTDNGDGCSSRCTEEIFCGNGTCDLVAGEDSLSCPQDCPPICGNDILELGEECEPPNTAVCDAFCQATVFCGNNICEPLEGEDSLSCPQDCPPVCGNDISELGEECDDGNTDNGDGCSSTCIAEDADGDAILAPLDNCPHVYNPFQADADFDTFGDACDCSPGNPQLWTNPSEVQDVRLTHDPRSGIVTISWNPPVELGATSVVYDTISSTNPADFLTNAITVCVESDDGTDTVAGIAPDPFRPAEFLQIRAENLCPSPSNIGSLGTNSDGIPRVGRDCP